MQVASRIDGSAQLPDIAIGLSRRLVEAADETGRDWTSQMAVNLYKVSTVTDENGSFSIGVGKGGGEDKVADSGTIKAFLNDHKQYRGVMPQDRSKAWAYLSEAAKEELALERLQGRYGGTVGGSYYYSLQNDGKTGVGIEPRHFIESALAGMPSLIEAQMAKVFNRA